MNFKGLFYGVWDKKTREGASIRRIRRFCMKSSRLRSKDSRDPFMPRKLFNGRSASHSKRKLE